MASILVVDDDRAVLGTIKLLLERAAHAVEAVDNSQPACNCSVAESTTCSSSTLLCRGQMVSKS